MLKIIYDGDDLKEIEHHTIEILSNLEKIFNTNIPDISIQILNKRSDLDIRLNKETPEWLVANASDNNEIDILSPDAIKNESDHEPEEFYQIITHELTHILINKIANGSFVPKWLNEGLASYIAMQHLDDKNEIDISLRFCEELSTNLDWNRNLDNFAYEKSSYFVAFLIDKYSFRKILDLISQLSKEYNIDAFKKIFFEIYKEDLNGVEKMFIENK